MPAVYRVMPQPRSSLVVRGNDPLVTKKPLLPPESETQRGAKAFNLRIPFSSREAALCYEVTIYGVFVVVKCYSLQYDL